MSRAVSLALLLLLLGAAPALAQGGRTFAYGGGVTPAAGLGLHLAASVEAPPVEGRLSRRLDLVIVDADERRAGFALASLVYRADRGAYSPYALGGLGLFTGEGIPLAVSAGMGVETTALVAAPLFLEARLLYGAGLYYRREPQLGIEDHVLAPVVTLGVRLPPKRRS